MKSDKMSFIIYANIEYRWAYSLWIFDVNNLGIWSHNKQKNIIDFEKIKMLQLKSHQDAKVYYLWKHKLKKAL